MNRFLLKQNKKLTLLKELEEDRLLFSRYYYKIPKIYSKNKTTSKLYFKYELITFLSLINSALTQIFSN